MNFLSRAAGRAVALTIVALLAACASNNEKEDTDPVELVDITASVKLERVWSKDIGRIDAKRYAMLQPALSAGRLVVANSEGEVTAFERNTGRRLWQTELDVEISGGSAPVWVW